MPDGGGVVIWLPDPRALRVAARSVLLATALLSLAWLRDADAPARRGARDASGGAQPVELLLRDLRGEGLLAAGARAVLLVAAADGDFHSSDLKQVLMAGDSSVDSLLDFRRFDDGDDMLDFADGVLKDGGTVAAVLDDYCVLYVGRFTETSVHAGDGGNGIAAGAGMEMAAPAALKEWVILLSAQSDDTTPRGELNYLGRKLLLPDIARTAHRRWFMAPTEFAALWNVDLLRLRPARFGPLPGEQQLN